MTRASDTSGRRPPALREPTRTALVFGGTGQIGAALLARLHHAGWRVEALSRAPRRAGSGLRWLQGEFARLPALPGACDAIFSCGPLDLFSFWYAEARIECPRVVAFGSTSLATKRSAEDPEERALAARLQAAEARILDAAHARGAAATLLRPTLVYGAGRDQNLTRIATLAARSGFFVLPRRACGLRQPVHVEDLAQAACAAVDSAASRGRAYALPGGETLPYREMVARTLAALSPRPRLVELPAPVFRLVLRAAQAGGRLRGLPPGAVARMREDLVFDLAEARADLDYAPRSFAPTADMFVPAR
ncbi:nucleoside-diphosphate sugar epimerase [Luteimonas sp. RD2P54]|uniref:Nucleoside-diphosphate sugar epimerase n=1 Tax=Luteimonas endophytica TaxID=3042023 RepID=A0ABT6J8V0_9GAMM|nr:nucleoside-diphosphate sugar epimerase [Luteimonas endophytica]MDH5823025.1 nucleoside-diphosphate sugar epimerase [Luteimonas endophytica]